jgi:pimeloyl-ACP methyl ester carboxylesterase
VGSDRISMDVLPGADCHDSTFDRDSQAALMDALKIEKAILGGYDWGARTTNIIAALGPERCKAWSL